MKTELWKGCLDLLEKNIPTEELYILDAIEAKFFKTKKKLFVYTTNKMILAKINQYKNIIENYAQQNFDSAVNIITKVGNFSSNVRNINNIIKQKQQNLNLSLIKNKNKYEVINVSHDLTFDSFIEGKSNSMAKMAAMKVAKEGKTTGNPLLIYGPSGLGKTHLMHAICNEISTRKQIRYVFMDSEMFTRQWLALLRKKDQEKIDDFKAFFRNLDLMCLDDIQFIAGKEKTQNDLFHIYNNLMNSGCQVIMCCDKHPQKIESLETKLKSRLCSGLPIAVEVPDYRTRVNIIKAKANNKNFKISDECASLIASKLHSNVRELEGALSSVIFHAEIKKSPITIPLIQEALFDIFVTKEQRITISNIQKIVADFYNVKISDLSSKKRAHNIILARQMAMYLSRKLTNESLKKIGLEFVKKDHSTVIYAIKSLEKKFKENSLTLNDYKSLKQLIIN